MKTNNYKTVQDYKRPRRDMTKCNTVLHWILKQKKDIPGKTGDI